MSGRAARAPATMELFESHSRQKPAGALRYCTAIRSNMRVSNGYVHPQSVVKVTIS